MIERKDGASVNSVPALDDSMVYIPLEEVPDGLLDKLPDFKVIVKDRQGEKILPKERLREVLKSMDRTESFSPGTIASDSTTKKTAHDRAHHRQSPTHSVHPPTSSSSVLPNPSPKSLLDLSGYAYENPAPPFATNVEIHRSQSNRANHCQTNSYVSSIEESIRQKQVSQSPNWCDFDRLDKNGGCSTKGCCSSSPCEDVTFKPEFGHEALRSFLENTPRKFRSSPMPLFRRYPVTGTRMHDNYGLVQPEIHQQKQRIDQRLLETGDTRSARKQLFTEGDCLDQNCDDHLGAVNSCRCCERLDDTDRDFPRQGLKRKHSECQEQAPVHHPFTGLRDRPRISDGVAEYLLQDLNSSQRHGRGCDDIGPSRKENDPPNCACSLMKSHFLRMTERAYRNIRRHDCTADSFDQFRKELTHTNSVLQESVRMLRSIQQICTHNNYHDR